MNQLLAGVENETPFRYRAKSKIPDVAQHRTGGGCLPTDVRIARGFGAGSG